MQLVGLTLIMIRYGKPEGGFWYGRVLVSQVLGNLSVGYEEKE